MLTVTLLEASKIALHAISGWRYAGIIEVMEHVRDGFEQHAAGSFKIAEDFATFRLGIDENAVA